MKTLTKLRTPLCLIVVIGAVILLANLTLAEEHHHSKRGSTGPTHPTPTATPTSTAAKGKSTGPTKPAPPPHVTDLSAKIAQMKLKEGNNVIHTEGGVKLMAEVKGGKVVGYGATDANGKALTGQITPYRGHPIEHGGGPDAPWHPHVCTFCVRIPFIGGYECYAIPCP
jgi:hypothetical protein